MSFALASRLGPALVLCALIGCGVQEHLPVSPTVGTGGAVSVDGTGGATGTGGVPGTGGSAVGTGGQPGIGGGGGRAGTGGRVTPGTGGQAVGTGGSTAVTININGTQVPKEKAIVFIHFGHSNMRGQANKPTSLMSYFYGTQPGLWMYTGGGTLVAAKEPTAPEPGINLAGPGMAILKSAAAAAPADYHFISIGRGNGSSPSTDFLKSSDLFYPDIVNRALELKGKVTFGAIVIMLGITERHLPTADQPGYPGRIKQIVSDMRADLGEPNLTVMYCDYEQNATGDLAPTGSVGVVILPLTRMLPGLISNLVLVKTDGLEMQDDHHFDMLGHQVWAQRVIDDMKMMGWFPWAK